MNLPRRNALTLTAKVKSVMVKKLTDSREMVAKIPTALTFYLKFTRDEEKVKEFGRMVLSELFDVVHSPLIGSSMFCCNDNFATPKSSFRPII